jgi:hypothetical protein
LTWLLSCTELHATVGDGRGVVDDHVTGVARTPVDEAARTWHLPGLISKPECVSRFEFLVDFRFQGCNMVLAIGDWYLDGLRLARPSGDGRRWVPELYTCTSTVALMVCNFVSLGMKQDR